MTKGITLSLEEALALKDLLNKVDLEQAYNESIAERQAAKVAEK